MVDAITADIHAELDRIEAEHRVQILFAIESGSRAWGFASKDSDYDVRFVYVHEPSWYLTVFAGRDVIECPISGDLDVSGWDLKKSIGLMRRSNPALMEWALSPVVYREHALARRFRALAREAFQPLAGCHHYRAMARRHQRRASAREHVKLKLYLYTLRPCLSALWLVELGTQPPIEFDALVERFLPRGPVREALDRLLTLKASSTEADTVERIAVLDEYVETIMSDVERRLPAASGGMSADACNQAFRTFLGGCWGYPQAPEASWSVWRQDDNGNRFEMSSGLARDEAERLVTQFTARGHKQLYWAVNSVASR